MKKLWRAIGRISFYLTYPLLALYINKDERTRVVVTCGNRVLLVKSWLGNGKWDLPGGGLHPGEKPVEGVVRELYEEVGIRAETNSVEFIKKGKYKDGLFRFNVHYFYINLASKPALRLQRLEITEAVWQEVKKNGNQPINNQIRDVIVVATSPPLFRGIIE